jgi:hypothetical protein
MKSYTAIIVFGIISATLAAPLTDEQVQKGQMHAKKCIGKTQVNPAIVEKLKAGDFSHDDEATQCFAHCFLQEADFVDQHGNQKEDMIIAKLAAEEKDKPMIKALVDKCKNVNGDSPCNRSFNAYKCYRSALQF